MNYIPSQLKNYFKNQDENTSILERNPDTVEIEKKSKINFNPYPYLQNIPSKLNFGEKKQNILQLLCKQPVKCGEPIVWDISLPNSNIQLIDNYKISITDGGLYHIIGQFCVTSFVSDSEDIDNFTLDLQVNYKSVSLIYCPTFDNKKQTVYINEILNLEKDDNLTVSMGNVCLVANDYNKLSIFKF